MRTISEAHLVVAGPPRDRRAFAGDLRSPRWALEKTRFDEALQHIGPGGVPDRGAIAVIDSGSGAFGHQLFTRRGLDFEYISPDEIARRGNLARPSKSGNGAHAAEVAGVIALACPDAPLIVYNVATTGGVERPLFIAALDDARTSRMVSVVNVSLGWLDQDDAVDTAIKACIDAGIVVVAAMGEFEEPNDFVSYPAACEGVIAVGATDRHDLRLPGSSIGDHIWIAAPGDDIETVVSDTDVGVRSGTSFAAPLVSAAVWLGLQTGPVLGKRGRARVEEVAKALGASANTDRVNEPPPKSRGTALPNVKLWTVQAGETWNMELGRGRLDVAKLLA